jgi:hypothetical protein
MTRALEEEPMVRTIAATSETVDLTLQPTSINPWRQQIVRLERAQMDKLLDEIADVAPHRLHEALERRMLRLIQRQVEAAVESAGLSLD